MATTSPTTKIGLKMKTKRSAGKFCFFYCQTRGGKANLDNEEDIIDIILFLIFFTIENILFLCALGTGAIGKSRRWREEKQDT